MARKSKIAKAKKQAELIKKYASLRQELKKAGNYQALVKLLRDSSPTRARNRDMIDGRSRCYLRKFGMSRLRFRDLAHQGKIPGVKKASW